MQSIINNGWLEIGRTIEKSIAGAFSDLLARAHTLKDALKGIWDSIKRSFTDMLGSMVSAFMMKFVTPMLTGLRTSMTASMGSMIPAMVMGGGAAGGMSQMTQTQFFNQAYAANGYAFGGGSGVSVPGAAASGNPAEPPRLEESPFGGWVLRQQFG
jgi:hypothetical protein